MRDEIVEEVRKIREEYAGIFDYDLAAIFQDLKQRELASGRDYVVLTPKRLAPEVAKPSHVGTSLVSTDS